MLTIRPETNLSMQQSRKETMSRCEATPLPTVRPQDQHWMHGDAKVTL